MVEEISAAEVNGKLKDGFGTVFPKDQIFYSKKEKEGIKVFLYSGKSRPKIKAEWIGLHVGTIDSKGFAPTIEGAQLLGLHAKINVLSIPRDDALMIMSGETATCKSSDEGYVLLEMDGVFFGAGYVKDGKINPLISPSRRIKKKLK